MKVLVGFNYRKDDGTSGRHEVGDIVTDLPAYVEKDLLEQGAIQPNRPAHHEPVASESAEPPKTKKRSQ